MVEVAYTPYGAVRQLWEFEQWPKGHYECLIEGPAGTGKSRGLLEWVYGMCVQHAGIRVLFLRKTKESLVESVLVTWETEVLWPGHACLRGGGTRNTRQHYAFPNGSHVVLGGLADERQTTKTFSTQYDIIVVFEARELPGATIWQWLARANRNWKIPWQFRIADTNPGHQFHWLNRYFPTPEEGGAFRELSEYRERPPFTVVCDNRHVTVIQRPETLELDEEGHVTMPCPQCDAKARGSVRFRLLSRFEDNPVFWNHLSNTWTEEGLSYVEGNLALLTGAPRANLYEGRWAAEEGVILEAWDPAIHVIDPRPPDSYSWYFGAFDKGLRHPGCLQVWGVQKDRLGDRMTRVLEVYRTEQNIDWWAERAVEAFKRFRLQAIVCDPSEPEYITRFNQAMGEKRGRDGEWIARRASNSILTGIDVLRWALSPDAGGPRLFVERGSLEGKDPARTARMQPACLEEEIPSWVWAKSEDGKPQRQIPDPACADHATDCARYSALFLWGTDLSPSKQARDWSPGSVGHVLSFGELLG